MWNLMRKKIVFILSLALLLTACGPDNGVTGQSPAVSIPPMNSPMPPPEYPVIDGSSSTINMHGAIKSALTDEFVSISHSQTYAALERLVPGHKDPADIVLAVKYYDETLQDAARRGADLVITPIAKEGFIFVTHMDNPVDSLTQRQLRDIYSGKITNWKDVGGLDETIVPFTRNWDSGSQTAMEDFMGDLTLLDNPYYLSISMGGMLDDVIMNGSAAIGYNIYSWSLQQWENHPDIPLKYLAVDGVSPSNENFANNSYPLIVYTYSYYNNGNEKGKALTDWLLTEEGQTLIASAGYVGIFGQSSETPRTFDDHNSVWWAMFNHYQELSLNFGTVHSDETDRALDTFISNNAGKAKAVTHGYMVNVYDDTGKHIEYRYIVLTRERGGDFEVIAEGLWDGEYR
jgi:ABC-type phosphate transport system substrate-binding protein